MYLFFFHFFFGCYNDLHYRLVEEADFKATAELFAKKGDEKTLDSFIPKSESDFEEYAELVSHKLRPYEVCDVCLICVGLYGYTLLSNSDQSTSPNCRKAITILDY